MADKKRSDVETNNKPQLNYYVMIKQGTTVEII